MRNRLKLLLILLIVFTGGKIYAQGSDSMADIVVAADGSGDYSSIGEALEACHTIQCAEILIYIKKGTYREKIHIDSSLSNIHLLGESAGQTIISYDDYAALKVTGNDITLENLTVENTAGFTAGQAVALHVEGDRFKAIRCRIIGNQDTLFASGENSRQFYSECLIEGTTDFIFGSATAIFDHCTLLSKKNSYITAANTPEGKNFGYVFRHCELKADENTDKVYLGRPWRDFAKVVFLNCQMENHIVKEGWHNWSKPEREKTAYYGEYKCTGPGSDTSQRVSWSHQLTDEEAGIYTIENILGFIP